jgi:hypothetical protein
VRDRAGWLLPVLIGIGISLALLALHMRLARLAVNSGE